MIIKSGIDSKEISLDLESNKKYGIMLSGGLDSAILFYIMLKDCANKGLKTSIQPYTIPKHDGSIFYVPSILQYLRDLFDIEIPDTCIVGNPDAHHRIQSEIAIREIFSNDPDIILYSGLNQNPNESFDYTKFTQNEYPQRIKKSPSKQVVFPFLELNKHHIIDLIYQTNQEKLFDLTHSCTEQQIGRCGICFQCQERQWAFMKLDSLDPGKN